MAYHAQTSPIGQGSSGLVRGACVGPLWPTHQVDGSKKEQGREAGNLGLISNISKTWKSIARSLHELFINKMTKTMTEKTQVDSSNISHSPSDIINLHLNNNKETWYTKKDEQHHTHIQSLEGSVIIGTAPILPERTIQFRVSLKDGFEQKRKWWYWE